MRADVDSACRFGAELVDTHKEHLKDKAKQLVLQALTALAEGGGESDADHVEPDDDDDGEQEAAARARKKKRKLKKRRSEPAAAAATETAPGEFGALFEGVPDEDPDAGRRELDEDEDDDDDGGQFRCAVCVHVCICAHCVARSGKRKGKADGAAKKRKTKKAAKKGKGEDGEPREPAKPLSAAERAFKAASDSLKNRKSRGIVEPAQQELVDAAQKLVAAMELAAGTDREANENGQPAIARMRMMDEVKTAVGKAFMTDALIEANLLAALASWLTVSVARSGASPVCGRC